MGQKAKDCGQPLKAGKKQSSLEPLDRTQLSDTLILGYKDQKTSLPSDM